MELKDFVKQTLLDVFAAVQEAGTEIAGDQNRTGAIAPIWGGIEHVSNHEQAIKFDIAVTATETAQSNLKGQIKVLGVFDFGGNSKDKIQNREVSRVSFSVPVAFPGTTVAGTQPQPRGRNGKAKSEGRASS